MAVSLFDHGNTGDKKEKHRDGDGTDGGEPGQGDGCDNDKDAPPDEDFPEVVGVTGVFPEAGGKDFMVMGTVFKETGELVVADGLEQETGEEDGRADEAAPGGGFIRRKPDKKNRRSDDEHKASL